MLVSGWQQALTLVAVLVPGFVYQGIRRSRVGPSVEDRDLRLTYMASRAKAGISRDRRGWIAPRSGGYRPGGEFATTTTTRAPARAPKGNAGVVKPSTAQKAES